MKRKAISAMLWMAWAVTPALFGQTIANTTQQLTAAISPSSTFVSVPSSVTLTGGAGQFQPFSGTLQLTYQARTTYLIGGGSITVQASADFSPTGGPTIASGKMTYTCSGTTLGSNCIGTQTVSTTAATNVVTLPVTGCGGGVCTNPNVDQQTNLGIAVLNSPTYATGNYTATLLFTISST